MLQGKADAGLLIHEGQLTYADNGLRKIVDLGEWWAERTGGLPLPLGGNIIRRDLGPEMIAKVSKLLHDSIAYALSHRKDAVDYAQQFGRGLDKEKTDKFVGMYVNDLTLGYGERGRLAVERLMTEAFEKGLIPNPVPDRICRIADAALAGRPSPCRRRCSGAWPAAADLSRRNRHRPGRNAHRGPRRNSDPWTEGRPVRGLHRRPEAPGCVGRVLAGGWLAFFRRRPRHRARHGSGQFPADRANLCQEAATRVVDRVAAEDSVRDDTRFPARLKSRRLVTAARSGRRSRDAPDCASTPWRRDSTSPAAMRSR